MEFLDKLFGRPQVAPKREKPAEKAGRAGVEKARAKDWQPLKHHDATAAHDPNIPSAFNEGLEKLSLESDELAAKRILETKLKSGTKGSLDDFRTDPKTLEKELQ